MASLQKAMSSDSSLPDEQALNHSDIEELQAEAKLIILDVIKGRCEEEGIGSSKIDELSQLDPPAEDPFYQNYHRATGSGQVNHTLISDVSNQLRAYSVAFKASPYRKQLRDLAKKFELRNYEEFEYFINRFIEGNISPMKTDEIGILFIFFGDVMADKLMEGNLKDAAKLLYFFTKYVSLNVCSVLQTLGGWGIFLVEQIRNPGRTTAVVAALAAATVVLYKLIS